MADQDNARGDARSASQGSAQGRVSGQGRSGSGY